MEGGYLIVQFAGERFAIALPWPRDSTSQVAVYKLLTPHVEEVRQERHVAPIANLIGHGALVEGIGDGHCGDGTRKMKRGFEQGTLEWKDTRSTRACPLGEEHDQDAIIQRHLHLLDDCRDIAAMSAVDEDRAA
jgi:hypothetical protein